MLIYLILYLAITGALTLLVFAMPSLVIIGMILLVVPGLILLFAPTAFLWGCVFAIFWWPLSLILGEYLAILPALAATAATLWFVPTPRHLKGRAMLARSILDDITPAGRFTPLGHVRIESSWSQGDNLTVALLLEPGVESVTVGSPRDLTFDQIRDGAHNDNPTDRTYRLVPKADCPATAIEPRLGGRVGLLGETQEENEAIAAEWALKLANDVCIVGGPARAGWDMLMRWGSWRDPIPSAPSRGNWSFGVPSADCDYFEVRSRTDGVLAREWNVRVRALARPLSIGFHGSTANSYFHWGRTQFSKGKRYTQTAEIIDTLRHHSTMRRTADRSALAENLAANLAAARANPATAANDPVWGGIRAWFTALAESGASEADRALAIALIGDPRMTWYDNIHKLNAVFADDSSALRAAIVARLLTETADLGSKGFRHGSLLFDLPPGSFATLTSDERTLLADPIRRTRAGGLIARLGDQGAAAAPELAELIRFHGAELRAVIASKEKAAMRSEKLHAHEFVIDAARVALCRMGPQAIAILPDLRTAETDGSIRTMGLRDWHRMLVRVGAPVETIAKPANMSGTDASYRRNLRHFLDRFDVERGCGRP